MVIEIPKQETTTEQITVWIARIAIPLTDSSTKHLAFIAESFSKGFGDGLATKLGDKLHIPPLPWLGLSEEPKNEKNEK